MKIEDMGLFVSRQPIRAIRISKENYIEISETLDCGDGCLTTDFNDPSKHVGEWYILEDAGGQLMTNDAFSRLYKEL